MSEIKKPSLKGMSNMGYLGHFSKDQFIQQGHNDVASEAVILNQREAERTQAAKHNAEEDADDKASDSVSNSPAAMEQKAKDAAAAKAKSDYDASPAGRAEAYENAPMATDKEQ